MDVGEKGKLLSQHKDETGYLVDARTQRERESHFTNRDMSYIIFVQNEQYQCEKNLTANV
jgi:hypothetical protein